MPIPGTPVSVTSCGSCSRITRVSVPRSSVSSCSRPTSGAPPTRSTPTRARAATRLPDRHRLGLALRLDRRRLAVVDRPLGRPVGGLVDEDRVRRRRCLQARGGVDDVAGGHALAGFRPGTERDQRLSGGDADADVQLLLAERVADRQRGPHRALRVVLVRDGRTEDGHHRVADELLDRPSEPLELRSDAGVVGLEDGANVFRVELLGAGREADEVAEEARDDLPLLACRTFGLEWRGALRAETSPSLALVPAVRAGLHGRRIGRGDVFRLSP